MKFAILLCIVCMVVLQESQMTTASPIKNNESNKQQYAGGRQQTADAGSGVQSVSSADDEDDDDDDEDDDDEPDLGDLVDDDDDDDDDEEEDDDDDDDDEEEDAPQGQAAAPAPTADDDDDDDDDDYLDRLFDDILGDEDDDDEDDNRPVNSVQNTVANSADSNDDVPAAGAGGAQAAAPALLDGADLPAENSNTVQSAVNDNTIDPDVAPAPAANTNSNKNNNNNHHTNNNEGVLKNTNNNIDESMNVFQKRNNHFVDVIFERINHILANAYDPFKISLFERSAAAVKATNHNSSTSHANSNSNPKPKKYHKNHNNNHNNNNNNTNKNKKTNNNNNNNSNNNKNNKANSSRITKHPNNSNEVPYKKLKNTKSEPRANSARFQQGSSESLQETAFEVGQRNEIIETKAVKSKKLPTTGSQSSTKTSLKPTQHTTSVQRNPNAVKDAAGLQKAEGTLYGLASLKRLGNVKVVTDPQGRNSTIKAKFTLGPLILRVEKLTKHGGVKNLKSATARTNAMLGRIKFSVVNDRATLLSIKLQQPKRMDVESKSIADGKRDFLWHDAPKIGKFINEKLKSVAEELFALHGVQVVRL